MRNRLHFCVTFAILMSLSSLLLAQDNAPTTAPSFRPYKRLVMTWVPPYSVAKAKAQLTGAPGMADALTHVGLQFWVPTKTGGVEFAQMKEVNDASIADLRDWGHAHGVRVLL